MKRLFVIVAIIFTTAATALAGDFEDGLAAYDKGDYLTAYMRWLPAAVHGNASAQFNLGVMCLEGKGFSANPIYGLAWISMAVNNMPDGESRKTAAGLRDKIISSLTPEQVKQADDLKNQWGKEHAEALKLEASGSSMPMPVETSPLPGQATMPTPVPGKPLSEQPQLDLKNSGVPPAEEKEPSGKN